VLWKKALCPGYIEGEEIEEKKGVLGTLHSQSTREKAQLNVGFNHRAFGSMQSLGMKCFRYRENDVDTSQYFLTQIHHMNFKFLPIWKENY